MLDSFVCLVHLSVAFGRRCRLTSLIVKMGFFCCCFPLSFAKVFRTSFDSIHVGCCFLRCEQALKHSFENKPPPVNQFK